MKKVKKKTKEKEENDTEDYEIPKGVDPWAPIPITKEDNPTGLLEESSFAILFPKYREKYLQSVWPAVVQGCKQHGIKAELNLLEGFMKVKTTRKTFDPYIIIKARDMLKLLSRSVPVNQALKIFDDENSCDVIKVSGFTSSQERFRKRRQRLIGPKGATLKALELLTGCYILVQGNTVSVMGPFRSLKIVRKVVEDCMQNVHPIYHVKRIMIKRELAKDPALKNEDWERFLPKFKKKNVKRQKPRVIRKKQPYTPFPPAIQPSKEDLQMESGEYFIKEAEQKSKRKRKPSSMPQENESDQRKHSRKHKTATS